MSRAFLIASLEAVSMALPAISLAVLVTLLVIGGVGQGIHQAGVGNQRQGGQGNQQGLFMKITSRKNEKSAHETSGMVESRKSLGQAVFGGKAP